MTEVPSPAVPSYTAAELVERLRDAGARVYRMREPSKVYCLTRSPKLAAWLQAHGAHTFMPPGMPAPTEETTPPGRYWRDGRTRQVPEWDHWIHNMLVKESFAEVGEGALAVWMAAA